MKIKFNRLQIELLFLPNISAPFPPPPRPTPREYRPIKSALCPYILPVYIKGILQYFTQQTRKKNPQFLIYYNNNKCFLVLVIYYVVLVCYVSFLIFFPKSRKEEVKKSQLAKILYYFFCFYLKQDRLGPQTNKLTWSCLGFDNCNLTRTLTDISSSFYKTVLQYFTALQRNISMSDLINIRQLRSKNNNNNIEKTP